jgi:hypothetical protein
MTQLLCNALCLQRSGIAKTNNALRTFISPAFQLTPALSSYQQNADMKYLALLSSFIHQRHSLSRATILQKAIHPHPSAIPSTNWDLDPTRHHEEQTSKPNT